MVHRKQRNWVRLATAGCLSVGVWLGGAGSVAAEVTEPIQTLCQDSEHPRVDHSCEDKGAVGQGLHEAGDARPRDERQEPESEKGEAGQGLHEAGDARPRGERQEPSDKADAGRGLQESPEGAPGT